MVAIIPGPLLVLTCEEWGFGPESNGAPCLSPQFLHLQMIQGMDTCLGIWEAQHGDLKHVGALEGA